MSIDNGILQAAGAGVQFPVPADWLSKNNAPSVPPDWVKISGFSSEKMQALASQIAYFSSQFDYTKVGTNNQVGAYQFTSTVLEQYKLLLPGTTAAYGTTAVNRPAAWAGATADTQFQSGARNSHIAPINNLREFLTNQKVQDTIAYRRIFDLYGQLVNIAAIKTTDSADVVTGMVSVAWFLGAGNAVSPAELLGAGAWAWRYYGYGDGIQAYNMGRYAATLA